MQARDEEIGAPPLRQVNGAAQRSDATEGDPTILKEGVALCIMLTLVILGAMCYSYD
jgi:hypothetical protein